MDGTNTNSKTNGLISEYFEKFFYNLQLIIFLVVILPILIGLMFLAMLALGVLYGALALCVYLANALNDASDLWKKRKLKF